MNLTVSTVNVANKSVAFTVNKSGEGLVLVSQKRLGELTGLKGAELKRAHFAYRLEAGKALNAGLSACMANGEIVAKSVVPTKAGGLRAVFDRVSTMNAPADKSAKASVKAMAEKLVKAGKFTTIEEAMAVLA